MFRKTAAIMVGILCIALLAAAAQAQGVKNFVVLPFDYVGPEKYQHYGKSIRSVMRSKLNTPGVFEPASDATAASLGATAPDSQSAAVSLLNRADIDYLIYGVISIAGDTAGLEVNAQGKSGNLIRKTADVPHDQLSLELSKIARQLTSELFNTGKADNQQYAGTQTANPTFLAAQPTTISDPAQAVNPEFRYEGGSQNAGRWQSQGLRFASRGMAICDGDGDGKNEVFILAKRKLMAYGYRDQRLELLGEIRFANRLDPLNLTYIDSNKDGRDEIIVTTFSDNGAMSYIYEYANGTFTPKVERSPYFLNVLQMPPNYSRVLVAQKLSHLGGFRSSDAMEAHISKGKIITSRRLNVPQFANIYNIAYLGKEDGRNQIVMLDNFNRLKVFSDNMEAEYMSQESYNSAAVPIGLGKFAVKGMETTRDVLEESFYYIPINMKVTQLFSKDEKWELLLNKDVSIASQIFARFKSFTQGEIHSMYWDGTGLSLAWKTRRIKGTVIDYAVVDVNNDGKKDLAVLVNTYPGAIAKDNIKTILLGYELNL